MTDDAKSGNGAEKVKAERLPEGVDGARLRAGTAVCGECGYSVRFEGDESFEDAEEKWWSEEHEDRHFGHEVKGGDRPDD